MAGSAKVGNLNTAGFVSTDASGNLSSSGSTSASFIQNTTSQQAGSSFNASGSGTVGSILTVSGPLIGSSFALSGNGTVGNTLTATNAVVTSALTGSGASIGTAVGVGVRADGGLNLGQSTTNNSLYLGYQARQSNTGFYNHSGYQSGAANLGGSGGVFSGYQSGLANTSGDRNTFEGYQSGLRNTSGNYNLFASFQSEQNNTDGSNNTALTALGNGATLTTSNTIQFGNSAITSLRCQVDLVRTSDARFKDGVQADVPGLVFVTRLRPVTYHFDTARLGAFQRTGRLRARHAPDPAGPRHTGFLDQEVAAAAPALGYDFDGVHAPANARDYYGLSYAQFVVPLVRAVQEQQAQLDALRTENAALQARAAQAETDHADLQAPKAQLARLLGEGARAQR